MTPNKQSKNKYSNYPVRNFSSAVHAYPVDYRNYAIQRPVTPTPASSPSSPSILSSIKDGFGIGMGVSLADRLTSSIFGPRTIEVQHNNCDKVIDLYKTGLQNNNVTPSLEQDYQQCVKK
jgi:hypothetical protein